MSRFYFLRLGLCDPQGETSVTPQGGATPAPGESEKIVIPSLDVLKQSALRAETQVLETPKPGEPTPPKPGESAPQVTPPAPVVESLEIPVDPYDESKGAPEIPTEPQPKKTAADFRRERLEKKGEKLTVAELERALGQEREQTVTLQARIAELEKQEQEREAALREKDLLIEQRDSEVASARSNYFDQNKAVFLPQQDPDIVRLTDSIYSTFAREMPSHIMDASGTQRRILPSTVKNASFMMQADKIIDAYTKAIHKNDGATADLAVNAMAELLGADVKVSVDPQQSKLIDNNSSLFTQLDKAMRTVSDDFAKRDGLITQFHTEAPKKALGAWNSRRDGISSGLTKTIFLSPQDRRELAQKDPSNPSLLLTTIIETTPALKRMAEQKIGIVADSFAALEGKIVLPTLLSNDPQEIQQHQQRVAEIRGNHAEIMRSAVLGMCAAPILSALLEERDALALRAGELSQAQNPGAPSPRAPQAQPAAEIPTDVYSDA